ncbi:hypothetical protein EJB05_56749 [Eragrostis curvula]|uniref:Uncharacterized protein n=1 Tax=Eragrostis curvula TaxID=38414 RepID=A0A5J9SGW7_9POAL|nr:hypothetical protein EJB05_56749 [Eragrostis curvula]
MGRSGSQQETELHSVNKKEQWTRELLQIGKEDDLQIRTPATNSSRYLLVFNLKNRYFLYSIPDENVIQEIKFSPGVMLLMKYDRTPSYVSLKISSVEDGKTLKVLRIGYTNRSWSAILEALEDVTVLFYGEDMNEIYAGNKHGPVHVWSN